MCCAARQLLVFALRCAFIRIHTRWQVLIIMLFFVFIFKLTLSEIDAEQTTNMTGHMSVHEQRQRQRIVDKFSVHLTLNGPFGK